MLTGLPFIAIWLYWAGFSITFWISLVLDWRERNKTEYPESINDKSSNQTWSFVSHKPLIFPVQYYYEVIKKMAVDNTVDDKGVKDD